MAKRFDWDTGNTGHFSQRSIELRETEEVIESADRVLMSEGEHDGERRHVVIGSTEAGRILVVIYTMRGGRFRVITARRPTPREARIYRRRRRR